MSWSLGCFAVTPPTFVRRQTSPQRLHSRTAGVRIISSRGREKGEGRGSYVSNTFVLMPLFFRSFRYVTRSPFLLSPVSTTLQSCPCLHRTKIITQETFRPIRRRLSSDLCAEQPIGTSLPEPGLIALPEERSLPRLKAESVLHVLYVLT